MPATAVASSSIVGFATIALSACLVLSFFAISALCLQTAHDRMDYIKAKEEECKKAIDAANAELTDYLTKQRDLELRTAQVSQLPR